MSLSCCGDKSLNPYDGKWQKNEDNAPDKEQEWTTDVDEWTLSNDAIKAEIEDLHSAISAVVEREEMFGWEAQALRGAWQIHAAHFRSNLEAKKEVVIPFLEQRINLEESDSRRNSEKIQQGLSQLDEKMSSLNPLTEIAEMKDILTAMEKYRSEVFMFCNDEEATERMLMRAFFTPEDVKPMVEELLAFYPPAAVGGMIYYAASKQDDGSDDSFKTFMNQQGISMFMYYWDMWSKRNEFESSFAKQVDAVTIGSQVNNCAFC